MRHVMQLCRKNIMYLVFEYTFKYRVRMAQMSLHYLYNQKIVSLHMDVKERTPRVAFTLRVFFKR